MRAGKLSGPLRMHKKLYTRVYGFYRFWRPLLLSYLKLDKFQTLPSTDYLQLIDEKFLLDCNARKAPVSAPVLCLVLPMCARSMMGISQRDSSVSSRGVAMVPERTADRPAIVARPSISRLITRLRAGN